MSDENIEEKPKTKRGRPKKVTEETIKIEALDTSNLDNIEVEFVAAEDIILNNIDKIMERIKKESKQLIRIRKYDGISLECSVPSGQPTSNAKGEVDEICRTLKLRPINMEDNKEIENIFILQFPELTPEYSEEEIEKMYKENFKWLVSRLVEQDPAKATKELLLKYKDLMTKNAITTYYRSNVNQYKTSILELLNSIEYREKINLLYYSYLDEYFMIKQEI